MAAHAFKNVDVNEANKLSQSGYTFLDVRTVEEFSAGHPRGAVNVPVFFRGAGGMTPNPNFVAEVEKRFPKDTKMVVSCQAGKRSEAACTLLAGAGYDAHANVLGGFSAWSAAGLPVDKA